MLRIGFNACHLQSEEMRGLTRYSVCLLRELSQRPDVELVLFSNRPLASRHVVDMKARVVLADSSRETVWNDWVLPQAIKRERIDVFHAPADRGLPLRRCSGLVVTVHDSYERRNWRELYSGLKRRAYYWKHETVNRLRADVILTVSETTRRALIDAGVAGSNNVRAVHLAPAVEFGEHARSEDALTRVRLEIPDRYVLYVGGYDRRKNVDTLIRAFSAAALGETQLVVVGRKSRELSSYLESWKGLPAWHRVRLIECDTADLPALYRGALFFVNASIWESFSFQTVEAFACGTPLLASNRTAIPEIAGEAALYFNPEDVEGLTRLMEKVASDRGLRQLLTARGLERAKRFSWKKTADETLAVYRELAASRTQRVREGCAN